jgi:MFS family permease
MTLEPEQTGPISVIPAGVAARQKTNIAAWRGAVFVFFLGNGFIMGSWASRIPAVANGFDLGPAQMGLFITAAPLGALIGLLISSHVLERFGERRPAIAFQAIMATGLSIVGVSATFAGDKPYLGAIGLLLYGLGMSTTNIVINLEAASVDRASGRTLMPMFHASWSVGAAIGAAVGALVTSAGVALSIHFPLLVLLVLILNIAVVRNFPELRLASPAAARPSFRERMGVWVEPRTLLIGVIVLAAQFNEGTANNWLSYAMVHGREWKEEQGALLVTVFTGSMMVGRFAGGWIVDRIGRALALRCAFAFAGVGLLCVVFLDSTVGIFVGVVLWGLGASLGYPLGISAAADDPHNAPARVAAVATVATISGLVGPTVIGLSAEHLGFPHAFLVVAALVIVGFFVTGAAKPLTVATGSPRS